MKELLMLNRGQSTARSGGERRAPFVEANEGEWLVLIDDRVGPRLRRPSHHHLIVLARLRCLPTRKDAVLRR
jgi:hypothetical protein